MIAFMVLGWGFLTLAIILVPRREIPKLQKFAGAGEENTREFGAFLDRIQKVHYAVFAISALLIVNGVLAVHGV